jgi:hypothetical protein
MPTLRYRSRGINSGTRAFLNSLWRRGGINSLLSRHLTKAFKLKTGHQRAPRRRDERGGQKTAESRVSDLLSCCTPNLPILLHFEPSGPSIIIASRY